MKYTWILILLLIPTLANAEYKFAKDSNVTGGKITQ